MPRWNAKLDDGRTVVLESETQPTEAEVLEAVRQFTGFVPGSDGGGIKEPSRIVALPATGEMSTTYGGPPKQVASLGETLVEPGEAITEPRLTTPKFTINPNDNPAVAVGKEAVNIAAGIPEFLSSNLGGMAMVGGAVAPATVGAIFTVDMLKSLGEQVQSAHKNWGNMTLAQKAAAVTDMTATGLFAGIAARVASKPFRTAKAEAKPDLSATAEAIQPTAPLTAEAVKEVVKPEEKPNASSVTSPESVPELEVRPRMDEATPLRQQGEVAPAQEPAQAPTEGKVEPPPPVPKEPVPEKPSAPKASDASSNQGAALSTEQPIAPTGVNFGMGVATADAAELVRQSQNIKFDRQQKAQARLDAMSESDLRKMSEFDLSDLLADVTRGPGWGPHMAMWSKDDFIKPLLEHKTKPIATPPQPAAESPVVQPKPIARAQAGKALQALVKGDEQLVHELSVNHPFEMYLSEGKDKMVLEVDSRANGPGTGPKASATTDFINWVMSEDATKGITDEGYLGRVQQARDIINKAIGRTAESQPVKPAAETGAKEPIIATSDKLAKLPINKTEEFPSLLEFARSRVSPEVAGKLTSESQVESFRYQWQKEKKAWESEHAKPPAPQRAGQEVNALGAGAGEKQTVAKAAKKVEAQVKQVAAVEGQRPAKEVKAELVSNLEGEIDKLIADTGAQVQQTGENRYSSGSAWADIEPSEGKFKVTISGGPGQGSKWHSSKEPTLDAAKRLLAVAGASAKGSVEIHIPGDGSFTVYRTGPALLELRSRAKRIKTGTTPAKAPESGEPTLAKDTENVIKAYGSPEEAYRRVRRQQQALESQEPPTNREEREDWNKQIQGADALATQILFETKAGKLEAEAEKARESASTYREGAKSFENEIARINKLKRKTARHKEDLEDLQRRYAENQKRLADYERTAEQSEQRAAKERAALDASWQPTPAEPPKTNISEGPGAASPGDVPMQDQLAQLTASIQQSISPAEPVMERIRKAVSMSSAWAKGKDAVTQSIANAKAASGALVHSYLNLPKWTNFHAAIGRWTGADQETAMEVRKFQKAIHKAVPTKLRQEAITNWIQADGDPAVLQERANASRPSVRPGYEAALHLNNAEKILARNISSYLDARLQEGIDAGLLRQGIDNYVTQIWQRPTTATQKMWADLFGSGTLNPNFKYARKRVFESYFEGEQAGFTPRNKSISALISAYDLAFNRALSARGLIKELHEAKAADGQPITMVSGSGSRVPKDEPVAEAFLIKPNTAPKGAVTEDGRHYRPIDHWALRDWKWATKTEDGQNIFVQGDMLVHPDHWTHLNNVLKTSRLRQHPVTGALLKAGAFAKQTKLSLSPFHTVQEGVHSAAHRVNPFAPREIDLSVPDQKALVDHGLMIQDPRAYELFAEGMSGGGLVGKLPLGIGRLQQWYTEMTFREYIPKLKMTMAMDALERNRKAYAKDIAAGKVTDDQILALTARESNAAFGEQNYAMMGRSPNVQDFLRLSLLAPDFLESRFRFVAQALKPYGREQQIALAIMAGVAFTASRILNKAGDNEYHWDKPFSVFYKGREYRLRTVIGDAMHLITDPRSFWYNRLSPITRTVSEYITGRDDRGIKRSSAEQFADFLQWFKPIPLQTRSDQGKVDAVLAASGIPSKQYTKQQELYEVLDSWLRKQTDPKIKEAYERERQETHVLSPYTELRNAVTKNDTKAIRAEYAKLRQSRSVQTIDRAMSYQKPFSGSDRTETMFLRSLSPADRALYYAARKERLQNYVRFRKALATKTP